MKRSLMLKAVAIASTGALLLAGCGSGNKASAEITPISNPKAGEVADGALKGVTLNFAGDGGTTQQAQMDAFFTPFTQKSGITFNQDSPQTQAKIQAQVDSGNYQWDFVTAVADKVARECDKYFEKLDMSKIDTSKVPEKLLGNTECGVPSIPYAIVLVSNDKTFGSNGPQTWQDFFDTKKFPGKRALYSGDGVIDGSTVEAAAIAAGWDPKTEFTADWAKKGLDKISSIKDSVVFWTTGAQAQQMMESGEADMAAVWNGRALAAEKNGAKLTPSWNNWIQIVDQFAILKGSPNAEAAYYAINYAYGAEQQAKWTEESGYSPVNIDAKPNVDDLTAKYTTTSEERQATSVPMEYKVWSNPDIVAPLQDQWASIVAGG